MKRTVKIALVSVGGVLVGLGLLIAGTVTFLKTPSGSRFLLSQVKSVLKKKNITLDYRTGVVDPFSSFHFEDLKVVQDDGTSRATFFAKKIDLTYQISLFSRSLTVQNALVEQPTLQAHFVSSEAMQATKTTPSPSSSQALLQQVRDFIQSPPLNLSVKQFAVKDLDVAVDLKSPGSQTTLKIPKARLGFQFTLSKNDLEASVDFDLGQSNQLDLLQEAKVEQSEIHFSPRASAKGSLSLQKKQNQWAYEVRSTELHAALKGLSLVQTNAQQRLEAKFNEIRWDSQLALLAKTKELLHLDPESFETVELKNSLTSGPLNLVQKQGEKTTTLQTESQGAVWTAKLQDDLVLQMDLAVNATRCPTYFYRPTDLKARLTTHVAKDFKSLTGGGVASLNEIRLAAMTLEAKAGSGARILGQMVLTPDLRLAKIIKSAASLKTIGNVRAVLGFNGDLHGEIQNFIDLFDDRVTHSEGDLHLTLTQESNRDAKVKFTPIEAESKFGVVANKIFVAVEGAVPELRVTAIKKPWKIDLSGKGEWEINKDQMDFDAQMKIQNELALSAKGTFSFKEEETRIKTNFDLVLGDYLEGILTLKQLQDYGTWRAITEMEATIKSPLSASGDKKRPFGQSVLLKGEGATTLTQMKLPGSVGFVLKEGLAIRHEFSVDRGKLALQLSATAPSLELAQLGRVLGTRLVATVHSPDIVRARDFDFSMDLKQGPLTFAKQLNVHPFPLNGLNASARASLRDGDRFTLEKFDGDFGSSLLKATAEANGKIKNKEFLTKGRLTLEVPPGFPEVSGNLLKGQAEFPWTLSVLRGKDITFEGNLELKGVGWSKQALRVSEVNGNVPLSEKLRWDGKRVKFESLITQNPFERVDFERLRPLIHGTEQVRIQEISFEDKKYGPFVGFFSMRQNMVFAHQFDLNIGSAGLVYGEMYFDVYPSNLQMGFLARMTSLNLADLLPQKYLNRIPEGNKNLSGRSGIVINLNKGSVDGRVDITEIGRTQLLTLINVLDPRYEDDKMNMTRKALGIGFPTLVQMAIQKGYLDLGMDLNLLGTGQRFDVRGIPISSFVTAATADFVKKTEEGALE
jgi:hypothetical protein